jgi:hypothetical protein
MANYIAREKARYEKTFLFRSLLVASSLIFVHKDYDKESALDIVLCTVRVPSEDKTGRKYVFEVMTPGKKKPVVLHAESENEKQVCLCIVLSQAFILFDFV